MLSRQTRGRANIRLNRIGNLLVPNSNYCAFEDWAVPILHQLVAEQAPGPGHGEEGEGEKWSPSKIIRRLGKEIDNEESVYYWCYKVCQSLVPYDHTRTRLLLWQGKAADVQNDIPVFCPALTDGSLGDMIYFHTYKTETQLSIDIVQDIRRLNDMSVKAKQAGMIILGGGVCKHQIANAMLFVSLFFHPRFVFPIVINLWSADWIEEWSGLLGVHQYRSRGMFFTDEAMEEELMYSMTVQIQVPDPMKQFHGVRSVLVLKASRSVHFLAYFTCTCKAEQAGVCGRYPRFPFGSSSDIR